MAARAERASAAARGYGHQWRRLRAAILARDAYRCHWCGARADQVDHLHEKDRGGGDDPANLVAACRTCNSRRGARYAQARNRQRRHRSSRAWL